MITRYLKKVFLDDQLEENSVCAKIAHTAGEDEKHCIVQYQLFKSGFDLFLESDDE
ncbi:MAG: hypothetical protein QM657_03240 [Lacrimispora sp.]